MWWLWARVIARTALATPVGPGPRGAEATLAPSVAPRAVTADLAAAQRHEHGPTRTEPAPPPPPTRAVALSDGDVLRALDQRQPSFLRCFRIAQRDDLMLVSARVALHVKVGPAGAIAVAADGGPPALDACVEAVARRLSLGAPDQPVEANLTLFFQ